MNGSLKLTLAVALALGSTNALALGLGMIQVKSGLNEPLVAEIPVTGTPDETAGVSVALAAATDFERVGLSRSRIVVPLEFTVATGTKGNAVIKVTTKEPVRDPFLDFLIEVNWAKGKLLREYTVLLDPPTMAPAIKGSKASTAAVRDNTAPAASAQLPAGKPAKSPGKAARAETAAAPSAPAAPAPAPARERSAAAGEYGPVAAGETLWEVAAATRPDDSVSLNQVMVALLRSNPGAFYKDNINSLKRGAILRVPSADEIRAAGTAAAAAAEVRSQNEAARGGGGTPTLVADSGSKPATSSAPKTAAAPKSGDRLELVPPKSGKDSSSGAERPGAGGTGDASVRAELARAKEALASSNQEASELKSRVRELEDLKSKNDKLLTLKDSELAALQQKLKELQDKSAAKPTTAPSTAAATAAATPAAAAPAAPASTAAAKPGDKGGALTKEEIWGTASSSTPPAGTSTSATPSTPAGATPPATAASTSPGSTATAPAAAAGTPAATPGTTTPPANGATPSTAPAATTTPPAPDASATPGSTTPATAAPATPGATTAPATTPAPATTTPAKPATSTTTPAKPSTPAKVQPLPAAKAWYEEPTTWMYGLGGLAVLGALGFLATRLRGKKAAPAAAGAASYAETTSPLQDEEDALLDRLAQYPDDTSAHLELTSLYYSQGDADKFEAAAQAMYAHIYDTNMPEWQQVQAMGRELVPSNPLFAEPLAATAAAPAFDSPAFGSYEASSEPLRFDGFDDGFGAPPPAPAAPVAEDDAFDFDLTDRAAAAPPPAAAAPADDDFSFDLTPPRAPAAAASNYQTQVQPLPPIPDLAPPPPSRVDDDLLASDDAIGTKLDLAKAYLDMGDPDGARSMLEEVLIEGSEKQKGEARKLLAEIR